MLAARSGRKSSGVGWCRWGGVCGPWGYYLEPAVAVGIFITATDAGPDQVAAHRLFDSETSDDPFTWILRQWCLQHQLHLIVKYSLALTRKDGPRSRGPPSLFQQNWQRNPGLAPARARLGDREVPSPGVQNRSEERGVSALSRKPFIAQHQIKVCIFHC